MSGTPLLVLIGPPGVGKSTVAVAVADVLGAPLRDTDSDGETTVGRPISEIFVEEGEETFRAAEAAAVADALARHAIASGLLIATYERPDGSVRVPEALVPYVGRSVLTP